jgi:hypothetical protein
MSNARALAVVALLASLVPPALLAAVAVVITEGAPSGLSMVVVIAWIVGLLHIVLLGLPLFVYLQRKRRLTPLWLGAAGFIAGLVPNAVIGVPRHLEGYSSGMNWHGTYVDLYVNGSPTTYAWLTYGEGAVYSGVYGIVTAMVALGAWRILRKPAIDA